MSQTLFSVFDLDSLTPHPLVQLSTLQPVGGGGKRPQDPRSGDAHTHLIFSRDGELTCLMQLRNSSARRCRQHEPLSESSWALSLSQKTLEGTLRVIKTAQHSFVGPAVLGRVAPHWLYLTRCLQQMCCSKEGPGVSPPELLTLLSIKQGERRSRKEGKVLPPGGLDPRAGSADARMSWGGSKHRGPTWEW